MDDKSIVSLGDGLFKYADSGGIFCMRPLVGVKPAKTSVTYDYGTYTVTVSWTESEDGTRTNPHWQRKYKGGGS